MEVSFIRFENAKLRPGSLMEWQSCPSYLFDPSRGENIS